MNYRIVLRQLGNLFLIEALLLLPSLGIAVYDGESGVVWAISGAIIILAVIALISRAALRDIDTTFYAREGYLLTVLAWISLSLFGALPFYFSGHIPSYLDAFFETVSGFTTTGVSIVKNVEAMPRALLFWRSLTQWLGGMGILVFMLALIPSSKGNASSMHLLRAESSGPAVAKVTSKTRNHAIILYALYMAMTIICLVFLLCGGMPVFDTLCITFGIAGTGGFSVRADSLASYSPYLQTVTAVFMLLFGVSFNLYGLLLLRRFREAFSDEELLTYIGIIIASVLIFMVNTAGMFTSFTEALHHSFFTASSIITSTGYVTVDFSEWPQLSHGIIILLTLIGSCAGSTGGGVKIMRVLLIAKDGARELRRLLHPRAIQQVKVSRRTINGEVLNGVHTYMTMYVALMIISFLLISVDNFSIEANIISVIGSLSNNGLGLAEIGPNGNYSGFSALSKLVLAFNMLLGRLEIFPILILLSKRSWNRAG